MEVRKRLRLQIGEYDWQTLSGAVRFFICGLGFVISIGVFGGIQLDGVNPRDLANQYRDSVWFLHYLSDPVLIVIAAVFNWSSLRYMLAPFAAIVCILIAGSYYVQDVYALPKFKDAFRYVMASMFGIHYPTLTIDKGEKQLNKKETNLIDKVGGPGFVIIEPGNGAMFRMLRGPSEASVSETYFLAPFEQVASAVNLDEQQGVIESMSTMTRDGIKVKLSDIHYRYRIKQLQEKDGAPVRRSIDNPYPFSVTAIRDLTFNLQVRKEGLGTWQSSVGGAVSGAIMDFVSEHTIDYLTAPRSYKFVPRAEIQKKLFEPGMKKRLADLGAELLWADVGHIEIEDESVDELRTNLWSAEWAGDASELRAYGDAIRQAYQELGRAEAQADLIMSIAGAMSESNINGSSPDNIRRILLARTAQLLSAMSSDPKPPQEE
jgi:hypothetical protein